MFREARAVPIEVRSVLASSSPEGGDRTEMRRLQRENVAVLSFFFVVRKIYII